MSRFANFDALVPRVTTKPVPSVSAVFEPRPSASATTKLAECLAGTAFQAFGTGVRSRDFWRWHVRRGQTQQEKTLQKSLSSVRKSVSTTVNLDLTFAGLHPLNPAVVYVSVASASTTLIPSTTRSAATDSSGFLERAARWAYHTRNRRGDTWCGD